MRNLLLLTSYNVIFELSTCVCQHFNSTSRSFRKFPEGFSFGAATSAYQTEGAWNEDGKSENIWDHYTHTWPNADSEGENGDKATNSYHLYKRNVEMARFLELDFYRFSISWTRILPTSFPDRLNSAAIEYYNKLINELIYYNIEPLVTVYHWDLPQKLQELGGWTNPYIVNWFADYARLAFQLFGDRVKYWITINEPHQICNFGYGDTSLAPAVNMSGRADYMCSKNVLLAHAKAYHIYDKEFRSSQQGSIFISLNIEGMFAATEEHAQAAEDANQFWWGLYAHPIFSATGDFPQMVKERVANKSAAQGFPRSRLPELTAEEVELLRGTSDYFGMNHYSSYYVYRNESVIGYYEEPSYNDDLEVMLYQNAEWEISESGFIKYAPQGFYKLLKKIKVDYENPPVFITENGFATQTGLYDEDRIMYLRGYLDALLDAVNEGCDIRGYTVWSLLDSYEWLRGYKQRFGLYEINYKEEAHTPRKSAFIYKEILRTRTLDMHYEPNITFTSNSVTRQYNFFYISFIIVLIIHIFINHSYFYY